MNIGRTALLWLVFQYPNGTVWLWDSIHGVHYGNKEAFILVGAKNNTKLKVFPFKPLLTSGDAQNVTFFNPTLLSMHCPF